MRMVTSAIHPTTGPGSASQNQARGLTTPCKSTCRVPVTPGLHWHLYAQGKNKLTLVHCSDLSTHTSTHMRARTHTHISTLFKKERPQSGHPPTLLNPEAAATHPCSPCRPLGKSMVLTSSSAMSKALNPLSFFSQKSCSAEVQGYRKRRCWGPAL